MRHRHADLPLIVKRVKRAAGNVWHRGRRKQLFHLPPKLAAYRAQKALLGNCDGASGRPILQTHHHRR
jgi:hypothetical protein